MRRPLIILIALFALAAAVFAGSFFVSRQICMKQTCNATDELDWLRTEFHLTDAEMSRVRQLHDGYMPKCMNMCARIAEKKSEIATTLDDTTNLTADTEKKLAELGELRARCQAQMLQHFIEVSRAMPPEQGKRYLAEMQRVTLGFHEQIEQTMSGSEGHEHRH
jgi:hypothetical protein